MNEVVIASIGINSPSSVSRVFGMAARAHVFSAGNVPRPALVPCSRCVHSAVNR